MNAALAGHFGVPVVLITGDQTACAQAKELLGADLETVVVKQATGRASAKNIHPTIVHQMIREAAERATLREKKREPLVVKSPVTLRLAVARSSQAENISLMPSVKRIAPRIVELTHDDYAVVFNAFRAMLVLGDTQA